MGKQYLKQRSVLVLALVVVLALGFLSGASAQQPATGPTGAPRAEPEAPEGLFTCNITDFWVLTTAVGVNCSPGSGSGIFQYAYPTGSAADSRDADRFLATANTAIALGKSIWLGYSDSATLNPPGCGSTTCRRVTSMLISK